jgi:hypothetical protein
VSKRKESAGDHRNTPESILEVVRKFGPIGLDPCSNPSSTVAAKVAYCAPISDGLKARWSGVAFVNPPWSSILPWATKCADEWHSNGVESLLLTRYESTTTWSRVIWGEASRVCLLDERPAFPLPGERNPKKDLRPAMISYFGDRGDRFERVFVELGVVVRPGVRRVA